MTPPFAADVLVDPKAARDRDRRFVWHTWTPLDVDRSELMLACGEGYRVWDVDGKEYVDAAGLNATCGYGHPHVRQAIEEQLSRLHHVDLSVASHPPVGLLAERLSSYLPEGLSKTLFVNSGSEGFEAAILIAAAYWSYVSEKRERVVALTRGYHGSTTTSRTLSGLPPTNHWLRDPMPVTHVDLPVVPSELRKPESLPLLQRAFEEAIGDGDPPSAVVVEPFLNVGGGIVLPPGFLSSLRTLCDEAGTLLLLDEVFTGFGRTGRMFACDREHVEPDILVASKGLASGYIGLGTVTVQRRIYEAFREDDIIGGLRYGHTTSGHPVACAAALATLDVIEQDGLVRRADEFGSALLEKMETICTSDDVVDVRGLGLALALEMKSNEDAAALKARLEENGLLLRQQGPVLLIVPPLIIDEEGIIAIAERVVRAVTDAPVNST